VLAECRCTAKRRLLEVPSTGFPAGDAVGLRSHLRQARSAILRSLIRLAMHGAVSARVADDGIVAG
jgi:hypothetical protein